MPDFSTRRIALGYTQETISEEIGVSLRAVQSWEQGQRPVPRYAERAIARLERAKEKRRPKT